MRAEVHSTVVLPAQLTQLTSENQIIFKDVMGINLPVNRTSQALRVCNQKSKTQQLPIKAGQ
jgi:hypothetical protein